jgi:hypothetical protein
MVERAERQSFCSQRKTSAAAKSFRIASSSARASAASGLLPSAPRSAVSAGVQWRSVASSIPPARWISARTASSIAPPQ